MNDQHQLIMNRDIYRNIHSDKCDSKWNLIEGIPDLLQVTIYYLSPYQCNDELANLYNDDDDIFVLICLTIQGELLMINRQYPVGLIVPFPKRITSIVEWYDRLIIIDEDDTMHIILSTEFLIELDNSVLRRSYRGVANVSVYRGYLYWLNESGYLNRAGYYGEYGVKVFTSKNPIIPKPMILRNGFIVNEKNEVFRIGGSISLEYVVSSDREIIDVCTGYPSTVTSILHDDGIVHNHTQDSMIDNIDYVSVVRFLDSNIELDDGRILNKTTGALVDLPGRLLNIDEWKRSSAMRRIGSSRTNLND